MAALVTCARVLVFALTIVRGGCWPNAQAWSDLGLRCARNTTQQRPDGLDTNDFSPSLEIEPKDLGQGGTPFGQLVVAGASIAEIATIVLLSLFFSGEASGVGALRLILKRERSYG